MMEAEELTLFLRRIEDEVKSAARKASQAERNEARVIASAEIDRIFVFKGQKADPQQSQEWPRVGVPNVAPNEIPQCVTQATLFLAAAYLAGYRIGPANLELSKWLVSWLCLILDPVIDLDASAHDTRRSH